MELSISNIAWTAKNDHIVHELMIKLGFRGLEIAPTRLFPEAPYTQLKQAARWAGECPFTISSMQSIWYGQSGNIFNDADRADLLDYTRKAINFASVIKCRNLVFGCPRNRQIPNETYRPIAICFFKEIAQYAQEKGCVIGLEANPPIYNTNFINTTQEALNLVKEVSHPAFLLNLDIGTMIHNNEPPSILRENMRYISHVHISEPFLKMIEQRNLHKQLASILKQEHYSGFVSIEMGKQEDTQKIHQAMLYTKGLFK